MTTATAPRRSPGRSATSRPVPADSPDHEPLRSRVAELLGREIDFIANPEFHEADAERMILADDAWPASQGERRSKPPRDLPPHLARLCETQLLESREETELFRRMNYLKFRANVLRSRLDPDRPIAELVEQIDRFLAAADAVRDHILRANMRLVISVVKKFVIPQYSFDEVLSDGIASLIQAVDKFDYDRGFRFSTYAYRAIARNAFRQVTQRQRELSRACSISAETGLDVPDEGPSSNLTVGTWTDLRDTIARMLIHLDRRERFIIEGRFALGGEAKIRTFQSLADELGVSKERVRQLEQRAVGKLRKLSDEAKLNRFADCLD